jgi:hypothetical protein
MGSLLLSVENRRTLFDKLQSVYDQHRFLDAYKLSADCWTGIHQNQRTLCRRDGLCWPSGLSSRRIPLIPLPVSQSSRARARGEAPESAKDVLILADLGLVSFHGRGLHFLRTASMAKPASVTVPTALTGSTHIEARRDCSAWQPDGIKWLP